MSYVTIRATEDGLYIHQFESEYLLDRYIHEDLLEGGDLKPECQPVFLPGVPNSNPNHWKSWSVLVIEGKIVVPQPVKVVEKYVLP